MSAPPTARLPRVDQLNPRQQMAIDCARCSRRLGMVGRVWGEARYRGRLFRLWVCVPECPPPVVGGTP
ncbi:hypothetical protein [Streptomyces flaveus]|uniref:Uncharacterized protein n=1 Tax=Streptomyces flaveus TaxID=66370 RepID=A0A917VGQ0_9ACTN|nr:hypothetical protein [Streptomyces flaveus]GGK79150.1 hypothetical protein GCM10010094_45460 [Streptomyces flaveus]